MEYQHISKPTNQALHLASSWNRYGNVKRNIGDLPYVGGILSLSREQFIKTNGFPNNFYGWGGEDDEFAMRLRDADIETWLYMKNKNCIRDLEDMNLAKKMNHLKENQHFKNLIKNECLLMHQETCQTNGLNTLKYTLNDVARNDFCFIQFDVNIELNGDQCDEKAQFNDNSWGF